MSNVAGVNYANGTPLNDIAAVAATAQTAFSGVTTGTAGMVLVAAGTTNGKRITRAWYMPTATAAAAVILWWYNPSSTTCILIGATVIAAVTPSTTVAPSKTFEPSLAGFVLPNGTNLYASITVAQAGVAGAESVPF
jgi:hypothetical protein